jgi:phosphatidylserine/phosphatidylglycerophosphate/cardiolipin synthase-like enzyme
METILLALSQAGKSIRIYTPYFIPCDQLLMTGSQSVAGK